jgi:hypothetical protein
VSSEDDFMHSQSFNSKQTFREILNEPAEDKEKTQKMKKMKMRVTLQKTIHKA